MVRASPLPKMSPRQHTWRPPKGNCLTLRDVRAPQPAGLIKSPPHVPCSTTIARAARATAPRRTWPQQRAAAAQHKHRRPHNGRPGCGRLLAYERQQEKLHQSAIIWHGAGPRRASTEQVFFRRRSAARCPSGSASGARRRPPVLTGRATRSSWPGVGSTRPSGPPRKVLSEIVVGGLVFASRTGSVSPDAQSGRISQ